MNDSVDKILLDRTKELAALLEAYPVFVPVNAAAAYLHIKPEALRASIDQCRCPFGFSWQLGDRPAYKIPVITFIAWLTKGVLPLAS